MGITETLFFDSYAFFEIIGGNPDYKRFAHGIGILTSKLNLMELYYGLSAAHGRETAARYFFKYAEYAVPVDFDVIPAAMDFRLENKAKRFSYADAIGYQLAQKYGVKFLTGDQAFKGFSGVEFVK